MHTNNHQFGFMRPVFLMGFIVAISALIFFKMFENKVVAASSMIKSGEAGYCLDDYKNASTVGNKVMLWNCNDSAAQNWAVNGDRIQHGITCLSLST